VALSVTATSWRSARAGAAAERALDAVAAVPLIALAPIATWSLASRWRLVPLPGDPDAGVAGLLFASGLLAVPLGAHVGRVARAALSDLAGETFLKVAMAKGSSRWRVLLIHALPVVAGPVVTVVASQLGALLGGAVTLERLFERWGLGTLMLEAYAARDLPVLEGAVAMAGLMFVVVQIAGSAVHVGVDPRVRTSSG
jgi:peptide/nickel transport system permease protein